MTRFREDSWRLALAIAVVLAIAWAPYLFFGKTLLASASDVPSLYPTGALPVADPDMRLFRSLDSGAPGWQNEPWLALQHRLMFDEHVLPMWDPNDGYGLPFAATMVAQPFYPLTLGVAANPAPWTYNLLVIGRLLVVGLGCALFVRLFVGFLPALVAGLCAAFSGYFLVYADICHIGVEVMLPWILLGVELTIRRAGPRSAGVLAAMWGLSLLGGMPESSALAALCFGGYAIARLTIERRDGASAARIGWLALGLIVGTMIAGIMLVPFVEFLHLDLDTHQPALQGLSFDPFDTKVLLTELVPLAFGPPVNNILTAFHGFSGFRGGPGMFAVALTTIAIVAALSAWRSRLLADRVALILAVTAILFESKRFGSPLVAWIGAFPLLRLANFPKYGEADIAVCVACAAGFGVAAVLERRISAWLIWASAAVVLGFFSWLLADVQIPANAPHPAVYFLATGLALSVFCAAFLAAWRTVRGARLGPTVLLSTALFECAFSYFVPIFYLIDHPASGARDPFRGAPYVAFLQHALHADRGRVMAVDAMLYPDWASAFDLDDVRNLGPMYPARYLKFVDAFVQQEVQTFDDQFDRFTGSRPIDFDDPRVRRWLALSSIDYIVTQHPFAPPEDPHGILGDLWNQNRLSIPPALAIGVHRTTIEVDGITENGLFDHAPNSLIVYRANVPRGRGWFTVDVSLDPHVFVPTCGGPVSFGLTALRGETVIGSAFRTIDPHHLTADRHWHRMALDLRAAQGMPVTVRFVTSVPPPGNASCAWAVWGEPRWSDVNDLRPYHAPAHVGFARVGEVHDAVVYHVDDSLARLTLFHKIQSAASPEAALDAIAHSSDVSTRLVIEGDAPPVSGTGSGDTVSVQERNSTRVVADVSTAEPAILLQNDTWYPGWNATVDGVRTPILHADYLFRGIPIVPGHHRVVIAYQSPSVIAGLTISLVGAALLSVLLLPASWLSALGRIRRTQPLGFTDRR